MRERYSATMSRRLIWLIASLGMGVTTGESQSPVQGRVSVYDVYPELKERATRVEYYASEPKPDFSSLMNAKVDTLAELRKAVGRLERLKEPEPDRGYVEVRIYPDVTFVRVQAPFNKDRELSYGSSVIYRIGARQLDVISRVKASGALVRGAKGGSLRRTYDFDERGRLGAESFAFCGMSDSAAGGIWNGRSKVEYEYWPETEAVRFRRQYDMDGAPRTVRLLKTQEFGQDGKPVEKR